MSTKKIKKSELKKLVREQIEQKDLNEFFGKFGKKKWEKEGAKAQQDTVVKQQKFMKMTLEKLQSLIPLLNQLNEVFDPKYSNPGSDIARVQTQKKFDKMKGSQIPDDSEYVKDDLRDGIEAAIDLLKTAMGMPDVDLKNDDSRVKNTMRSQKYGIQRPFRNEDLKKIMKEVIEEMKKQ